MTIGEFSEKTGISCSALRYYEEKGLIRVKRDFGNRRIFDENDIEWVKFLQRLKNTGMQLKDMKQYSDLRYQGDETMQERLLLLQRHRRFVDEKMKLWKEYSDNLDEKIRWYQGKLEKQ